MAFFDPGGGQRTRVSLGEEAARPQVVAAGGEILTVDGTGRVRGWSAAGERRWSQTYAPLARHRGGFQGARLLADEERVAVLFAAQDTVATQGGHMDVFQYLEVSTFPL